MSSAAFMERFTDQLIEFDFIVQGEDDYLIIECRNMLILEN